MAKTVLRIDIPTDTEVQAAVGRVALRHGHLDHILKLTIKSILGITVREALDATRHQGSRELRERVRRLAKQNFGEGEALVKLDALLERARRSTETRNTLLHRLWAHDDQGNQVIQGEDHQISLAPSVDALDGVSSELADVGWRLNKARLGGFLKAAIKARGKAEA